MNLADAQALLARHLNLSSGPVTFTLVATEVRDACVFGTVQLWLRDADGNLENGKEQQVLLLTPEDLGDERLEEAVRGWAEAMVEAGRIASTSDRWDSVMPYDLCCIPALLRLRRAQFAADFCDAMLRNRKRLGGVLDGAQ